MKARRSWRNQDRLYRQLGESDAETKPASPPARICANCVSFPNNGRSRGECALQGVMTRCTSSCEGFRLRESLPSLDDVLDWYSIERQEGVRFLSEYQEKYPQYAAELAEFEALRLIDERIPDPEISAEDEARLIERATKIVNEMLASTTADVGRVANNVGRNIVRTIEALTETELHLNVCLAIVGLVGAAIEQFEASRKRAVDSQAEIVKLMEANLEDMKLVDARAKRYRAALEAVEWDWDGMCPWCQNERENGHKLTCQRQTALGTEPPDCERQAAMEGGG